MHRIVIVILPFLFVITQGLHGQVDNSGNKVFSGKIVDDSLGYALPFVHLWNESTRQGDISNDSGEFSIKVRSQDTVVFSALGYFSEVFVVSSTSLNQRVVVRLKPKKYEIGEAVIRRFRSYESFKYQVIHLDLPEPIISELREYIKETSIVAAVEADRERAIKDKLEFGYSMPLSGGINPEKAFKEKIRKLKNREQIINEKYNRALVGDITQLEGDELSNFMAFCAFNNDYLFETDLYTITEDLYAKLDEYQNMMKDPNNKLR